MQSILALDVSGKCTGWAFGSPDCDKPISGTVEWKTDGATEDEVFLRGQVWLFRQIGALNPQIVAIEAPIKSSGFGTNPASQAMLIGLQGALRAAVKSKLPGVAHLVASNTARKTFIGKGGGWGDDDPKLLVQQECLRRGYIAPEDVQGDRCDAICLWAHMAAQQIPMLAHGRAPKAKAKPHFEAQEIF